jgi:hypothetical protein
VSLSNSEKRLMKEGKEGKEEEEPKTLDSYLVNKISER